ncbi:hypothetical protein MOV66_16055 [Agrobacterium sp. SHOUNA12C]|uniref:hypothetical protein n=1 Tax=Rhizobium sp. AP16 TaxID=1144306 RepID=UPI00026ED7CF|nr:hypothetical protein [Rhizobium sp. AP16]EJK88183.1 hypothetical protein PMI03_00341 [Rhizobium sp. AP16]MCJ9724362.1 hypothetical protein [Agrobacterium sp. BETTINA12B]MCJ9758164.1 hypothetical protein [Agrobacterium sp. SHOUNA12C]
MAVLHHAFRCAITPALKREISELLAAWEIGDREKLSAMAVARYAALAGREDIHAAFYLGPEGAAQSWLQPQFISPGLAALVVLAQNFAPLPTLSAGNDTNHHRLETHLPALGWSPEEIDSLIHGQPIETMLHDYANSADRMEPGGFRHTGGWTPPGMAQKLGVKLDRLALEPPKASDKATWSLLNESKALDDARAMLAPLRDNDWLVTAITH